MSRENLLPGRDPKRDLDISVSAPGKIILSGEHSVVYPGCPAIAASINKRCRCRLRTVEGGKIITLELKSFDYTFQMSLSEFHALEVIRLRETLAEFITVIRLRENLAEFITINQEQNATEIKNAITVILFLLRVMLLEMTSREEALETGLILTISSDLVLGAGSGSSAAFAVSVAGAVYTLSRWILASSPATDQSARVYSNVGMEKKIAVQIASALQCDTEEVYRRTYRFKTTDPFNMELDLQEDKEIVNFFAFHGERITHGKPSGLDNTICTYGGLVTMRKQEKGDNIIDTREDIYPLEILLVDTGVSRSTANLVKRVADLKARHEDLFSQLLKTFTSVTEEFTAALVTLNNVAEIGDEFKKLEDLVVMNQGLLTSLGVSHPKLNQIIDICSGHGLQAKLTGAGGGGFAFALVPPGYERERLEACVQDLEGKGFAVTSGVKLGGVGVELEVLHSV